MIGLDLRSIIILCSVMALLLSTVLLFLRFSYPKSVKGLALWAAAPAVVFVSALLAGLRGQIPDAFSIIAANVLLLTSLALFYFGTQQFFGFAPSYRRWLGVIVATVPVLAWFTLIQPSFTARVLLVTAVLLAMNCMLAVLVWRNGKEVFSIRYIVVVLLVQIFVLLLRFVTALVPLPGEDLLDPSRIQTLYVASYAFILLALGIGVILMASDRLRDEFEHAASHDSLTNALLRRTVIEHCEQELERCRRHGRNMVLLMLDIDHFKTINDTHGHQMGDRVLIDFVNRITPLLRRSDQLGRFGGEEFVVLLPETSQEEALVVAERIRVRVELPSKDLPPITVSIGMTSNHPDEAQIDVLLARADKALYKAKEAGRNRIVVV
jgi:diguanylate cyclase (GGDEF)-like protein